MQTIPIQFFFTSDGKPYVLSNLETVDMRMYSRRDTGEHVYTAHQGGLTKEQVLEIFNDMGGE